MKRISKKQKVEDVIKILDNKPLWESVEVTLDTDFSGKITIQAVDILGMPTGVPIDIQIVLGQVRQLGIDIVSAEPEQIKLTVNGKDR